MDLREVHDLSPPLPEELWLAALQVAERAHAGQTRWTAEGRVPYIVHPVQVMLRLLWWGVTDEVCLVAALLHDVVEDAPERVIALLGNVEGAADVRTEAIAAIARRFGADVAAVVDGLTNRADVGYVEHVREATADPRVLVVKLADFSENGLSLDESHPRYKRLRAKYAPLMPVLATRLRSSMEAQRIIPAWEDVLDSLR